MPDPVANLLSILDLEPLERNLYRGTSPQVGWQRVFGGLVISQALVAATRTVDDARRVHSLHGYFMRPGDPAVLYAAAEKARAELHWTPRFPALEQIVETAWNWHRGHPHGYGDR